MSCAAPVTFTVHLVDYNPYETEDFARATPPAVSSSSQVSVELFEAVVDPTGTSPGERVPPAACRQRRSLGCPASGPKPMRLL
eukprot:scaffold7671_cov417-Prasinococcus_capsulatus_cf.AAC.9